MKVKQLLIVIITLLFLQPNYLNAQSFKVKNYKLTVKGTSSLHDWESVVEKFECKTSYKIETGVLTDIADVIVKIPVQSLKSSKGKMMDNKTYDAFSYQKHPWIIFTQSSKKINASNSTVEFKGPLTMAGVTRQIEVVARYKVLPNGDLQVIGSKKIKMTDFKMEPPTAMMGTVKVGDEVTLSFDIVLSSTNTIL